MKKSHYEKTANEIITAAKELCESDHNPFREPNFRRAKKLIIEMLKSNFIAKKSKWI